MCSRISGSKDPMPRKRPAPPATDERPVIGPKDHLLNTQNQAQSRNNRPPSSGPFALRPKTAYFDIANTRGKTRNGAGWSSPVARQAHNLKAAGSNPAPATKSSNQCPL